MTEKPAGNTPDQGADRSAKTPIHERVAYFWRLLETEPYVRVLVEMRRATNGDPHPYWDSSSFPDDVVKAIGADRSADRKPREVRGELIEQAAIAIAIATNCGFTLGDNGERGLCDDPRACELQCETCNCRIGAHAALATQDARIKELEADLRIKVPQKDSYVVFSEGGGGSANRLVIQFERFEDMQAAHLSAVQARAALPTESAAE